ncbi:MAG: NAD-dependent epimerase/dehydratase family protein [Thermoguttaceae bacterium]
MSQIQNILVTGASGFIGMHVVRRLVADGHRVRCLIRSSSSTELIRDVQLDFVHGELGDADSLAPAVTGIDTVYHLAGLTHALNESHFITINAGGTENLLRACASQPTPPRVVVVSSLAAAGPARRGVPLTEHDIPRPISPYGRSKFEMERRATQFADRLKISVVRPPYVVGEADAANAPLFRMIARYGLHPSPGWCDRDFSFVHAADLTDLIVRTAVHGETLTQTSLEQNSPDFGRGIYFASTTTLSFHEFGRRVGAALGREATRILRVPPVGVWGAAVFGELKKQLTKRLNVSIDLNKGREAMSGPWTCSSTKAETQLGFVPPCPFDERLRQTAAWYREHGEL